MRKLNGRLYKNSAQSHIASQRGFLTHFPCVNSVIWISFHLKQYLEYLILGRILRIDLFVSMKCNKQFWFCEFRILVYWGITLVLCRGSRSLFKIRVCACVCLYVERKQKKKIWYSTLICFPTLQMWTVYSVITNMALCVCF